VSESEESSLSVESSDELLSEVSSEVSSSVSESDSDSEELSGRFNVTEVAGFDGIDIVFVCGLFLFRGKVSLSTSSLVEYIRQEIAH
jgi:hypothetical protein